MTTKRALEVVQQPAEPEVVQEQPKKRTMPVRIETLELEGDYEGWSFTANRNFTFGELEDLASLTYVRMMGVLKKLVTGWTDFVDREGKSIKFVALNELPPPGLVQVPGDFPLRQDPWRELGTDLIVAMARAVCGLPSVPNR